MEVSEFCILTILFYGAISKIWKIVEGNYHERMGLSLGIKSHALQDAMSTGIEYDHWGYITVDIVEFDDSDEENAFINEQHRQALKVDWDHFKLWITTIK